MKNTPSLDEKVNIYDTEMSKETIETYEKYYKNKDECNKACDNEKKMDCDDVNKVDDRIGNDLSNKAAQKMTDSEKCDIINDSERKRVRIVETSEVLPCKKRKKEFEPPKLREENRDIFCWRCHKYVVETDVIPCYFCPRVFHLKCVHIQEKPAGYWLCTECDAISTAENPDKISPAISKLKKQDLAELLMFVLKRMRQHEGSSHYENPVDLESYPDYKDYIVKPMYLALLESNVKKQKYSSCESFLADTKWMVHNSYVFNTVHSELTLYAKAMMKNAKHECEEIINCPDCYLHANTLEEDKWFIEPCDKPHVLVWARLKGFPYWPCKVMKANGTNVDVRFFGDHNKSLVPVECCYLYSKQMPSKQKKIDELEIAIKEASQHIKRLEERFHVFQYAPLKTVYNPKEEDEQRKLLLPYFDKPFFIKVKDREKLFDPDVINIFDNHDPLSFRKTDLKEELKTSPISQSSNALEVKNKKIVLKHIDEFPHYRISPTLNIKNMKSPPCNKPTIIIEDTDSDLLSQDSLNHSRQSSIKICENLSSPCFSNKAKLIVNEKHLVGASPITSIDHDHDISKLEFNKNLNCMESNNNFKNNMATSHSTKEQDNENDDNRIDLVRGNNMSSEKLKNDEKQICLTSKKKNCLTLTNPSLDKYNKKHFADKLGINSNAKLIQILTDKKHLRTTVLKQPLVVLEKLRDDIFLGYTKIYRKDAIAAADKKSKSDENHPLEISSSDKEDNATLNLDLLNGNLAELVSVTEIDLDKDESLSRKSRTSSKEAENVECSDPRTSNGLRSSRPIIKEEIDDDELLDSDYIERLSKSILESTLDDDGVQHIKGSTIFHPDTQNSSYDNILVVARDEQSLNKDEAIIRSSSPNSQNSSNEVIHLECSEDVEELNTQKSNGITKSCHSSDALLVVDPLTPESDMDNKAMYLWEEDRFQDHNMFSTKKNDEIESNVEKEPFCTQSVENSDENIELVNSNENCQKRILENRDKDIVLQNEKINHYKSETDFRLKRVNSENESCNSISSDDSEVKEIGIHQPVLEKEANAKGLCKDSDCEIVKIVFPSNSKTMKPYGFKKVKTCGGVIKKVIKNGLILGASRSRQDLKMLSKANGLYPKKLLSKTKFHDGGMKQLNNHNKLVTNFSTSNPQPTCSKGAIDLKNVLEKCADNMVSGTERVREQNKIMNLQIHDILNKVEKIETKEELLGVLREELERFEEHCKTKIESYKNAYIEEMDSLYTMEKQRLIQETMNVSENESKMMVDEIKRKQWCILCLNEAKFHCCWSTSYCSEKCQLADWPVHMKTCTQYAMRIGDPDLRLSPELKKILKGENNILNQRIKDLLQSNRYNGDASEMSSPSCSSSSMVNSHEVASKGSILTSPKSSTVYVQKNVSKHDTTRGSENTGNPVMKIVSSPVYVSGMVVPPNQTKNIIHVSKQNPAKPLFQDQYSVETSGNNKHVLFSVPVAKGNKSHVPIGKTFNSNKLHGHNSSTTGGQQYILPKLLLPTKVIKKTIPIKTQQNMTCVKGNNNTAVINAKPLYISMQNISRDNSESSDEGLRDPLEIRKETKLPKERPKLLERNSSSSNRETSKPPQSFLIVEKSGETAQYTYKIGFKEDVEKIAQANLMSPSGQKSTVCAVQPLSYPIVCNTPSTSTDTSSTHVKN